MKFSDTTGVESIAKALVGMVDSGRIPHAIMFEDRDGGQAFRLVQAFLQYLFCRNRNGGDSCGACPSCNKISKFIHPDVHYIYPVNGGLSVDYIAKFRTLASENPNFTENELEDALGLEGKLSMIAVPESKALIDVLSLSALEGGYRAVVVYLPEKLNREAANRLLKIVEEPPQMTQFLFITHSPESVLTTIASRCQRIRLMGQASPARAAANAADETVLLQELMGNLIRRDLASAIETGEKIAALPSREREKFFCRNAASSMRRVFLLQQNLGRMAPDASEAEREWASQLKKTFPRHAAEQFSFAVNMIDRNINEKILFTELVDRLYVKI